jgi:hypothetical protein
MKNTNNEIKITAYCVPSPPDELDEPGRFEHGIDWEGKPYAIDTHKPSWIIWCIFFYSTLSIVSFSFAAVLLLFLFNYILRCFGF